MITTTTPPISFIITIKANVSCMKNITLQVRKSNLVVVSKSTLTRWVPFAYTSGAPESTPGFQCYSCYSILYMYVLQIVVCPFVLFLLAIVLSVLLRYTDSDYPFGIFKLFLSPSVGSGGKWPVVWQAFWTRSIISSYSCGNLIFGPVAPLYLHDLLFVILFLSSIQLKCLLIAQLMLNNNQSIN